MAMVPARLLRGARAGNMVIMSQAALDGAVEAGWAEPVTPNPSAAIRDDNPAPEAYLQEQTGYADREMRATRDRKIEAAIQPMPQPPPPAPPPVPQPPPPQPAEVEAVTEAVAVDPEAVPTVKLPRRPSTRPKLSKARPSRR